MRSLVLVLAGVWLLGAWSTGIAQSRTSWEYARLAKFHVQDELLPTYAWMAPKAHFVDMTHQELLSALDALYGPVDTDHPDTALQIVFLALVGNAGWELVDYESQVREIWPPALAEAQDMAPTHTEDWYFKRPARE